MAEPGTENQVFGETQLLRQGHPQFDELLTHADAVVEGLLRAACT